MARAIRTKLRTIRTTIRAIRAKIHILHSPLFKQIPLWEITPDKGTFHKLSDEQRVEIKPSRYFGRSTSTTIKFRHIPFQWYAVIRSAVVYNPSWAITSGTILWQQEVVAQLPYSSAGYSIYFSAKNNVFRLQSHYALQEKLETAALIAHRTGFNYLHAFCEILPKIMMLDAIDPDKKIPAIIDTAVSPNIVALVVYFLKGRNHIVLPETHKLIVKNLYVFSTPAYMPDDPHFLLSTGTISPYYLQKLAKSFKIAPNQPIALLFVSRSKYAQKYESRYLIRNVINHGLLEDELGKLGAEFFYPEEHSWQEQREKFAAADRIVMVVGAACTNLIFCRPGTKVLLLANGHNPNYGFFSLMLDSLALDYAWLLGNATKEDIHSRFAITPEDLQKSLDWLMKGTAVWDGEIEVI